MKDAIRSGIIAGLAILAVAFAASTLNSTVVPKQGGANGPNGRGGEGGGLLPVPQSGPPPGETIQIPLLTEILTFLTIIALLAFVVYVVLYWRETFGLLLAAIALLGLLGILLQFIPSLTGTPRPPPIEPGNGSIFGGGDGSDATRPTPPSLIVLLVLGLTLIGAVVALLRTTTDESDEPPTDTDDERRHPAAVGRAAGRAADRLEAEAEVDVDNEVYRSWREMTELLDVDDPETSTPGEFVDAAVEAGFDRDDVQELTRLFEDVRYGDREPSEDYEQRAIAVFRRIEARYAEDDP